MARYLIIVITVFMCLSGVVSEAHAEKKGAVDTYYASIRSSEANVRTGPNVRYPIQWVYQRKNWPVKIIASFEQWKKIADIEGEEGWIHETLLTNRRHALIQSADIVKAYRLPVPTAAPVLMLEKGVIVGLKQCQNGWCKIHVADKDVWLQEQYLWGVDKGESFE